MFMTAMNCRKRIRSGYYGREVSMFDLQEPSRRCPKMRMREVCIQVGTYATYGTPEPSINFIRAFNTLKRWKSHKKKKKRKMNIIDDSEEESSDSEESTPSDVKEGAKLGTRNVKIAKARMQHGMMSISLLSLEVMTRGSFILLSIFLLFPYSFKRNTKTMTPQKPYITSDDSVISQNVGKASFDLR